MADNLVDKTACLTLLCTRACGDRLLYSHSWKSEMQLQLFGHSSAKGLTASYLGAQDAWSTALHCTIIEVHYILLTPMHSRSIYYQLADT